jgi:hypothetical protein
MRHNKFRLGDSVRAVSGPGYALQPEHRNLGRCGTVTEVHPHIACEAHYVVAFGPDHQDTIDESCLEIHHA